MNVNRQELEEYERFIAGAVALGDYQAAAAHASEHGPDAVLAAMNAAFKDGYNEALKGIVYAAGEDLKRLSRGRKLR